MASCPWNGARVRNGRKFLLGMVTALVAGLSAATGFASDFSKPWTREDRALVIDAYEYNKLDWQELASDKRIVGFINKASDGLPPPYFCTGDETQFRLCKSLWHRHAMARELYNTRRTLAKALGLKWGAYHLGRPGNPVEQARNFLDFAAPGPDDLMALDIEENDPSKWISLEDAEVFVREIHLRTGRYPVLYTNGNTAQHIADNAFRYKLLSRLPLWYARYKPEIGMHFPKGNWDSYALWQFASQTNCNKQACPYRVRGANVDIDVNVASMSAQDLRKAWPFGGLVPAKPEMLVATVPVPFPRELALAGPVEMRWAAVASPPPGVGERVVALARSSLSGLSTAYSAAKARSEGQGAIARMIAPADGRAVDAITTASVPAAPRFSRDDFPVLLLKPLDRRGEEFEELFWRTGKDGPAAGDDDRAVDQDRMRQHEIDKLLVAPFLVSQAELVK